MTPGPVLRRRLAAALPLVALVASGCSDDPADNLVAVILGTVVGLMVGVLCGCSAFTGMIAAGAISIRHNLAAPTWRSKRWGFAFGALNLVDGAAAFALLVAMVRGPEPDADSPTGAYLTLTALGLAAIGVGATAIWAAAKAVPRAPERPRAEPTEEDLE